MTEILSWKFLQIYLKKLPSGVFSAGQNVTWSISVQRWRAAASCDEKQEAVLSVLSSWKKSKEQHTRLFSAPLTGFGQSLVKHHSVLQPAKGSDTCRVSPPPSTHKEIWLACSRFDRQKFYPNHQPRFFLVGPMYSENFLSSVPD